jgi:hypothetical protein
LKTAENAAKIPGWSKIRVQNDLIWLRFGRKFAGETTVRSGFHLSRIDLGDPALLV